MNHRAWGTFASPPKLDHDQSTFTPPDTPETHEQPFRLFGQDVVQDQSYPGADSEAYDLQKTQLPLSPKYEWKGQGGRPIPRVNSEEGWIPTLWPSPDDGAIRRAPESVVPLNATFDCIFSLPNDVILCVLDQLVGTLSGDLPVARSPSDPVTKALHSLVLTSKIFSRFAKPYLYRYCLSVETKPGWEALKFMLTEEYARSVTNKCLNGDFNGLKLIHSLKSLAISPKSTFSANLSVTGRPIPLGLQTNFWALMARNLKRLILGRRVERYPVLIASTFATRSSLRLLVNLDELVCDTKILHTSLPFPENLKRLAVIGDPWSSEEGDTPNMVREIVQATPSLCQVCLGLPGQSLLRILQDLGSVYDGKSLDLFCANTKAAPLGCYKQLRGWKSMTGPGNITPYFFSLREASKPYVVGDGEQWVWDSATSGELWYICKKRMVTEE